MFLFLYREIYTHRCICVCVYVYGGGKRESLYTTIYYFLLSGFPGPSVSNCLVSPLYIPALPLHGLCSEKKIHIIYEAFRVS